MNKLIEEYGTNEGWHVVTDAEREAMTRATRCVTCKFWKRDDKEADGSCACEKLTFETRKWRHVIYTEPMFGCVRHEPACLHEARKDGGYTCSLCGELVPW